MGYINSMRLIALISQMFSIYFLVEGDWNKAIFLQTCTASCYAAASIKTR